MTPSWIRLHDVRACNGARWQDFMRLRTSSCPLLVLTVGHKGLMPGVSQTGHGMPIDLEWHSCWVLAAVKAHRASAQHYSNCAVG